MNWETRVSLYKAIEERRGHPLIAMVTSKRGGAFSHMAADALPCLIDQLDQLEKDTGEVDLLLASLGGDPMTAWRIVSLIRQRFEKLSVIIPNSAYSAATVVALGADEIIIHPNGHLGPVDMQITTFQDGNPKQFSTEDISAFLEFVRDTLRITDQEHIRVLFEQTCKEVGSLGIGFTARSTKLAVDLGERMLALHMKNDEQGLKLRTIVENMSRKFQSHAYPVSRNEAIELGLPIAERDEELEKLIWELWLNIASDLKEDIPFDPLVEFLNSAEGTKLLNSTFEVQEDGSNACQSPSVGPIDFEVKLALLESVRGAHSNITRGKIFACRTADLSFDYNAVTLFRGWQKEEQK